MFNYLTDLKGELELYKAHDFCPSGSPRLTVVFIHGIAADSSSFKEAISRLETELQDVRFVAFDLLGAGKSYSSDLLEYNFEEQIFALANSIKKLEVSTPLVLVGHSMGTLLATRYVAENPGEISELILVSPPVYTPEDIESPLFKEAMMGFRAVMAGKNPEVLKQKSFEGSIKNIVSNPGNYRFLVKSPCPTTLIYGEKDEIIARFNIPKLLKENPNIREVRTEDRHGVSSAKTEKILRELERTLDEAV